MNNPLLNPPKPPTILALRQREAAAALGLSVRTLFTLTKAGEIPHVKLAHATLYDVADLRAFLEARKTTGGSR